MFGNARGKRLFSVPFIFLPMTWKGGGGKGSHLNDKKLEALVAKATRAEINKAQR